MARVRLDLDHPYRNQVLHFRRPGGTESTVPMLRLRAFVRLVGQVRSGPDAARAAFPYCILDTGSHLSVVPRHIWRHFLPGIVTWLPFDPATPPGLRVVTVGGGSFPFDLGEIARPLVDRAGGRMDVAVVAMFTRDGGVLNVPLTLDLRGGFLDGRNLLAGPDPVTPHGQSWTPEDP